MYRKTDPKTSRQKLIRNIYQKILNYPQIPGSVAMLEADIVMGSIVGKDGPPLPIMAHPPATTSDLTLAEFLETIAQHNMKETNPASKKGAKLDFKSIEAYEQSQELISKYQVRFSNVLCITPCNRY